MKYRISQPGEWTVICACPTLKTLAWVNGRVLMSNPAIKALNRADVNLFCDTVSIQGQVRFFLFLISTYFTTQNIYLKIKVLLKLLSNRVSLLCIKIRLWKICPQRCRLTQNWAFLYTSFLENKAQIDQNNYRTTLFMPKLVSQNKSN